MGFLGAHGGCRGIDGSYRINHATKTFLRHAALSGIPGGAASHFGDAQDQMTNKIAIFLGLIIIGGLIYDRMAHDWANTLFLARKMADLIEWMAFWR